MIRLLAVALAAGVLAASGPRGARDDGLAVALILDVSTSMDSRWPRGGGPRDVGPRELRSRFVAAATRAFVESLQRGDHAWFGRAAGTVAFTGMFEPASTYVDQQAGVFEVTPAERFGGSPIWDALDGAVRRLAGQAGRRAIIIWTDGRASGNLTSLRDVAIRAQAAAVAISVVCAPTDEFVLQSPTTAVRVRPSLNLAALARATGGAFVLARDATGPADAIRGLLERLRTPPGSTERRFGAGEGPPIDRSSPAGL